MLTRADIVEYELSVAMNSNVPDSEKDIVTEHIRRMLLLSLSRGEKRAWEIVSDSMEDGVTYRDICEDMGVSKQYACNLLRSFHDMGLTVLDVDTQSRGTSRARWYAKRRTQ